MGKAANLANIGSIADTSLQFRNRLINSDMRIDQRNAGASVANIGNGAFIVDRFYYDRSGLGVTAQFTANQSTDAPTGFRNSIKLDTTTAQTLGATGGTYIGISHKIEGFNMADLAGVACTLSFWVKATKTGTYSVVFKNSGADRSLVVEYTVSASNTWEQKTLSVAALPTAGTWNYTNGTGLQLFWCVAVADDVATSTIGSWVSSNVFGSTSNVEGADSTANDFLITGVQLEAGTVASPFERVEYGAMLRACQRYYYRQSASTAFAFFHAGFNNSTTRQFGILNFPQMMRATPTLETTGTASNYQILYSGSSAACTGISLDGQTTNFSAFVIADVASGLTAGQGSILRANNTTSAYLGYSAEL